MNFVAPVTNVVEELVLALVDELVLLVSAPVKLKLNAPVPVLLLDLFRLDELELLVLLSCVEPVLVPPKLKLPKLNPDIMKIIKYHKY